MKRRLVVLMLGDFCFSYIAGGLLGLWLVVTR